MIGGTDILIPTRAGGRALDACVRAIRRHWPDAVFEDAETGVRSTSYDALAFGDLSELFAYQDSQTADGWNEDGASASLENTMIHLFISTEELTVVVDDPAETAMAPILSAIRDDLRMPILNLPARLKEAA